MNTFTAVTHHRQLWTPGSMNTIGHTSHPMNTWLKWYSSCRLTIGRGSWMQEAWLWNTMGKKIFHTRKDKVTYLYPSIPISVEQGFWKPQGYTGKGMEGRGQGMECLTPHKPLPVCEGRGIPMVLPVIKQFTPRLPNKQTFLHHHHHNHPQRWPPTLCLHYLTQPSFDCLQPRLHTPTTMTTPRHQPNGWTVQWQCHVTSSTDGQWWPGTSLTVPCRPDGDDTCCRHCPY